MRVQEKAEARRLRQEEGLSLGAICKRLQLSKGTVSNWIRDIELTKEQKDQLKQNYLDNQIRFKNTGNTYVKESFRGKRVLYQNEGRTLLRELKKDCRFIAGIMLFWAEGSKDRSRVIITNSDINMLLFFIKFLKKYFMVDDSVIKFSFQFYSNNGLSVEQVKDFWLRGLNLPEACMKKFTVDKRYENAPGKKVGKLLYGVGRIVVNDTRIKQMIFGAIQEYIGFDKPEWLG